MVIKYAFFWVGRMEVLLIGLFISSVTYADDVFDVYVVYSGTDKAAQREFMEALPDTYNVKSYNVDILAIADYSGVQKATANVSKARVVVFLFEGPQFWLDATQISSVLVVVEGSNNLIRGSEYTLHVRAKSNFDQDSLDVEPALEINSLPDLQLLGEVQSGEVVLLNEQEGSTIKSAAGVVAWLLDNN